MKPKHILKLFIASNTVSSQIAVSNLSQICCEELNNEYHLEIIDVLEQFEQAEAENIVATPTLLLPLFFLHRRLIGSLSNRQQVLQYIMQN